MLLSKLSLGFFKKSKVGLGDLIFNIARWAFKGDLVQLRLKVDPIALNEGKVS